jgi:hypothetical protein
MLETIIEECLERDPKTSKIFLGVFARNELPKQVKYLSCLVFNTKPRSHAGEHWCAIFYDSEGKGTAKGDKGKADKGKSKGKPGEAGKKKATGKAKKAE